MAEEAKDLNIDPNINPGAPSGLSVEDAARKLAEMRDTDEGDDPGEEEGRVSEEQEDIRHDDEKEETEEESAEKESAVEDGADPDTLELGAEEIASLLGVKEDRIRISDDGEIHFTVKEGDETSEVNLDKLINSYQGDANLTNRAKALSEMQKKREAALNDFIQQSQQTAQQASMVIDALSKSIVADYEGIDWKSLKEEDPQQYAALKVEKSEREQALQAMQMQAAAAIEEQQRIASEELQKQFNDYIAREQELLKTSIPNWDNVKDDVKGFLEKQGFSGDEIKQIADHRILKMAHDSMLLQKGKETARKKAAKPLPKMMKPGARKSKATVDMEELKAAQERFNKTRSLTDAVKLRQLRKKLKE